MLFHFPFSEVLLVVFFCCYKLPRIQWLQTTHMYPSSKGGSLTGLKSGVTQVMFLSSSPRAQSVPLPSPDSKLLTLLSSWLLSSIFKASNNGLSPSYAFYLEGLM